MMLEHGDIKIMKIDGESKPWVWQFRDKVSEQYAYLVDAIIDLHKYLCEVDVSVFPIDLPTKFKQSSCDLIKFFSTISDKLNAIAFAEENKKINKFSFTKPVMSDNFGPANETTERDQNNDGSKPDSDPTKAN